MVSHPSQAIATAEEPTFYHQLSASAPIEAFRQAKFVNFTFDLPNGVQTETHLKVHGVTKSSCKNTELCSVATDFFVTFHTNECDIIYDSNGGLSFDRYTGNLCEKLLVAGGFDVSEEGRRRALAEMPENQRKMFLFLVGLAPTAITKLAMAAPMAITIAGAVMDWCDINGCHTTVEG